MQNAVVAKQKGVSLVHLNLLFLNKNFENQRASSNNTHHKKSDSAHKAKRCTSRINVDIQAYVHAMGFYAWYGRIVVKGKRLMRNKSTLN